MNNYFIQLEEYKSPKITESKRDEWVEFGEDNNYFQYLIDRYNNSTTNNAIINNIIKLNYGKGIKAKDAKLRPNEYARFKMLFSDDTVKKVIADAKIFGNYAFQVIYNAKKEIAQVEHIPVQLLRAEKCNDKGEIEAYYYSDNWQEPKKFVPKRIPAFGFGGEIEILFGGNYTVGQKYYSNVDYIGALPYAKLEEEIADYLINEVQNGFAPTTVVNFNNGVPDEEKQRQMVSKVEGKLTGAKGKKVIVGFNSDETRKTTVDTIPLNDAPAHYEYLSEECMRKIMLGHAVTSPLLFGIATTTGFSSNADELKNSYILYDNMVIKPLQENILSSVEKIMIEAGIMLNLYFDTLQPFNVEGEMVADSTDVQMSSHLESIDLDAFGEDIDENEWELIDSRKVDYDQEDAFDAQINAINNPKQSLLSKVFNFVSTGTAYTTRNSEQDNEVFRTRYRYSGEPNENSREFCTKMLKANKLYRKEDIISMGQNGANAGWGANGADNYDIFLYKGGGGCHHFWTRETYRRKGTDINSPLAQQVSPATQRKEGYIAPKNDNKVYQKPVDMPNKGFLPK